MGFTTQFFIFIFFPLCIAAYGAAAWLERSRFMPAFLKKLRLGDLVLICASLGFYLWNCFDDAVKLCLYMVAVYFCAKWIEAARGKGLYLRLYQQNTERSSGEYQQLPLARFAAAASIIGVILILVYFKYSGLLTNFWNFVFEGTGTPRSILAPLGLSFITFSAISYLADVYRGDAGAGSFLDCALYLSFFPKVVSGPIVLWKDFQPQIQSRKTTLTFSTEGLERIMIGFAKKILLADQFGRALSDIGTADIDTVTAFGTFVLYMLQLYYDFAGYSDIAIGLSKLFGFEFKENFNFPYRSKSISEFWRRWHISLGTWFREYVYFPLGGSRCELKKTLRNLAVVFVLTGIWHGAGWNYILWGCVNGAFVLLERVVRDKPLYRKTPDWVKYLATMAIVMGCWQLFRFEDVGQLGRMLLTALGLYRYNSIFYTWQHFFDAQMITFMVIGILGATILGTEKIRTLHRRMIGTPVGLAVQELTLLVLFALAIMYMVNSTYSPFLYFQY